jgi:hypothetical protein
MGWPIALTEVEYIFHTAAHFDANFNYLVMVDVRDVNWYHLNEA